MVNSFKATQFGTYVEQTIFFLFTMNAKAGIALARCIRKIQDGRHTDLWYTVQRFAKGM